MHFLISYLLPIALLLSGCVSYGPTPLAKQEPERKCTIRELNSSVEKQFPEPVDETIGKRVALVIGNGNYEFLDGLRSPLDDAEDIIQRT